MPGLPGDLGRAAGAVPAARRAPSRQIGARPSTPPCQLSHGPSMFEYRLSLFLVVLAVLRIVAGSMGPDRTTAGGGHRLGPGGPAISSNLVFTVIM